MNGARVVVVDRMRVVTEESFLVVIKHDCASMSRGRVLRMDLERMVATQELEMNRYEEVWTAWRDSERRVRCAEMRRLVNLQNFIPESVS